jgi:putative ABC transport system substrate-binding protein
MRRRDFIRIISGSAAAWPLAARAQQASKPMRIGYLAFRAPLAADDAFLERLGSLGWIEGQNIYVDRRFAAGDMERLTKSAAELVHLQRLVIPSARVSSPVWLILVEILQARLSIPVLK